MKRYLLFMLGFLCCSIGWAQSENVRGFVIDSDNKARLAKVYIYNATNDEGVFNNAKGEFSMLAQKGDTLYAALGGYAMDTVVYRGGSMVFQLKSLGIALKQVDIYGQKPSPQELYDRNRREFKYALDRGSTKNMVNAGPHGLGISIDAIYNLLSRQGKNARRLQGILEKDYREAIIDYRYQPSYVSAVLGNPEIDLKDFMQQYRPTYQFVLSASDYALVQFIRNSYNSYKRNPAAFRLPNLPKIPPSTPQGQ